MGTGPLGGNAPGQDALTALYLSRPVSTDGAKAISTDRNSAISTDPKFHPQFPRLDFLECRG